MNIRKQLQAYLELRGLSAAELARKSGVSRHTLQDWLGGSVPRNVSQIKKVADALGTTVDCLCFGDGVDREERKSTEIDALLGDSWVGGLFEIRIRRVRKSD